MTVGFMCMWLQDFKDFLSFFKPLGSFIKGFISNINQVRYTVKIKR